MIVSPENSTINIENFTYSNVEMAERIRMNLQRQFIMGVKGSIEFDSKGDPIGPVQFQRLMGRLE